MCEKIAYSYRRAGEVLNAAHKRNTRKKKIPKRRYYCDKCRQWHLTSLNHWGAD